MKKVGVFACLVMMFGEPGCARKPATSPRAKATPTVAPKAHKVDMGVEATTPTIASKAHKVDGGVSPAKSDGHPGEAGGELCVSRIRVSKRFKPIKIRTRKAAKRRLKTLTDGLTVKVDDREEAQFSTPTGTRVALSLDGEHVVIVRNKRGRRETLVRFNFKQRGSSQLCLWYREMYDNWHLYDLKEGHRFKQCLHCRLRDSTAVNPKTDEAR